MNQGIGGQPPQSRIASLFIDPVTRFFLAIILFVALLFACVELSAFCLVLLLLSTGAKQWRRVVARRMTCRFQSGRARTFPNEPLDFGVEVFNGSLLPLEARARLLGAAHLGAGGEEGDLKACKVAPYGHAHLKWTLRPRKRGVYTIGPLLTEAGDALGLFHREIAQGHPFEVVVYPRLFPITPFLWQARELFGSLRAKGLIEDPVNLMGTREYHPGRPARYIHWKASARINRLQEKVFEPTRRAKLFFCIDVSGFHKKGDDKGFEEMLEAVGSIAVRLIEGGMSVGMITNARLKGATPPVIPVTLRPGQLPIILELLARMTMEPATARLAQLAKELLKRTTGAGCVHCSHSPDKAAEEFGAYVLGRKVPISFLVSSTGKTHFPGSLAGTEIIAVDSIRGPEGEKT